MSQPIPCSACGSNEHVVCNGSSWIRNAGSEDKHKLAEISQILEVFSCNNLSEVAELLIETRDLANSQTQTIEELHKDIAELVDMIKEDAKDEEELINKLESRIEKLEKAFFRIENESHCLLAQKIAWESRQIIKENIHNEET